MMQQSSASTTALISDTYQDLYQSVLSIFRSARIDDATCKDMTQDVFVRLMGIDMLREESIKSIVFTIAYSVRTDYFRHRAIVQHVHKRIADRCDQSYTDTLVDVRDIRRAEMRVVKTMPELTRKVYVLSRYAEMVADDLAIKLNISKRAVEARLYRSRMQVREQLKKVL